MNVSLTPKLEQFVKEKIATGNYTSASEVMREALRLLQEEDQRKRQREPERDLLEQRKQALKQAAGLWRNRTDLPDFSALRSEWDRQP